MSTEPDVGPIGRQAPEKVVRAAGLVREGRMISLAAVRLFLFVALPLKIRGATGSMVDPVTVV